VPPPPPAPGAKGLFKDWRVILQRGGKVWSLVSRRHKLALGLATLVMSVTAVANTAIPVLLGSLVNTMQGYEPDGVGQVPLALTGIEERLELVPRGPREGPGAVEPRILPAADLERVAITFLVVIAFFYVLREALLVWRRWLVQSTATQIEKDTVCGLVTHLLKIDLTTLSSERVGALHGRIGRSVDGFVRFV
jgi:ATP-binding cassette subfamily B protein